MYYFLSNKKHSETGLEEEQEQKRGTIMSELVYFDFLVRNEVATTKILKTIPNSHQFFYLIQSIEQVSISAMDEHEYETRNIRNDNSVLIKFKNQQTTPLNVYLKSLTSSRKFILQVITFYEVLLKSIGILLAHKIVHNNIGFNTTLINYMETPLLGNFSYSINIDNPKINMFMHEIFREYTPDLIQRPMEHHILSYLISNKISSLSMHNIHTIIEEVYENNPLLNHFGNNILTNFKAEAAEYYKKYVNKKYEEIINDVILYHTTWDNYGLSVIYLNILIGIHKTIQKKNKLIILFMRLLMENVNPNPYKRNTLETTMQKLDFFVQDCDQDDFIYLVKHL